MKSAPRQAKSDIWDQRTQAMSRDLQFISRLLGAQVYERQHPNLFERLQEFTQEVKELQASLSRLGKDQQEELAAFENNLIYWKARVYEFIESHI
ncbi:MAG: hypothetical protein P8X60_02530 [Robiginitalea sp.]